jgi:N-acetylglucosamine-6-phosphate deacetylase
MLALRHATLITPAAAIADGALLIDDGHIIAVGNAAELAAPPGTTVIDAAGLTIAPGFIDMQFNGGFGLDFTEDPTTIWAVGSELPRYGVTAFLPTIITSPLATVSAAQAVIAAGPPTGYAGARSLGLHLEGPFLNRAKKGAHNPAHLRPPSAEAVADWSPGNGVALVTLAPELPGALEVVRLLAERGILVSAGHSMATYDQAQAGFDAGIRYGTHLFNAMTPLHHREPGLTVALMLDPRITVGIIADCVHVAPELVALAWRAAGAARVNLVTDAMAALAMPPGAYRLGDFDVDVSPECARLEDGTLAGCILALDEALRNLMGITGCALPEAVASVTDTPARLLGLEGRFGQLAPGAAADLVLLDASDRVQATFIGGLPVYQAPGFRLPTGRSE